MAALPHGLRCPLCPEPFYSWDAKVLAGGKVFHSRCFTEAAHDKEPECSCRFAGDMADATECEAHNGKRVVAEEPVEAGKRDWRLHVKDEQCPF